MASKRQYLYGFDSFQPTDVSASYSDYLQQRQFSDSVSWHITKQIKQLITANDQALHAQIRPIGQASEANQEALYEIKLSIDDLRIDVVEGFSRVGSILDWGLSELVMQLTRTNDHLSDLLLTVKTPSQAWAFEQFERARDEYRRGLYPEALESLDRAITGFESKIGNKTEHRFHFLRGLIYLGSRQNTSPEIVDLAKARHSFEEAARYATHDFPLEAATALLFAARAANLLGDYEVARELAHGGLGRAGLELAGLHYEAAKALINLDKEDLAADHALEAIRLDKMLIVMVSGEGDFTTRSGFVERVLTAVLEDAKENLSGAANQAKLEIEKIKNLELEISTFDKMCTITGALSDEISYLDRWVMNNFTTISEGGAFDMRISLEKFPEKYDGFYEVEKKFRRLIQDDLRNLLKKYKDKSALEKLDLHYAQKISNMILDGIPILVGIGIFILGLIYSISQYRQESITEQYYTIIGVLIVPFIFCVILTLITRSIKYFQTKFYDSSIQNLDLAYGNYNSEINREIARLDRETIYEPSKDVASLLPKWCIGMTDRPLFNYNWNAFLNNNELCEPHFNFPSMVWR